MKSDSRCNSAIPGKPREFAFRLLAILTLAYGLLLSSPACANGWEHQAVPAASLLKALESDDPAYRARAALSLGIKKHRDALGPLRRLIESGEPSAEVRAEVYRALGRIADPAAVDLLAWALQKDENPAARQQAAWALGALADEAALTTILRALDKERDPGVRSALAGALGGIGDPRAEVALLKLLEVADPGLRNQTIRAMGRMGSEKMVAPLLAALAGEEDPAGQVEIVNALAMIGDPASRLPLESLLERSGSDLVRTRAVLALGAIRDGSSIPALVDLLDLGTPEQKYLALDALIQMGDAGTAPVVAGFYGDVSSQLEALGRGADQELPDSLLAGLRLQRAALRALLELDPAAGVEVFLHAARSRSYPHDSATGLRANQLVYESRRLAISGLGYTASERAFVMLVSPPVWDDPDHRIRAVATRAAAVSGHVEAYHRVAERLADDAPEVRWTAASALGRLGNGTAAEPLRKLLADPHSEVRRQAVLSLAYLDARPARQDIERLASEDASYRVRDAASQALDLLN